MSGRLQPLLLVTHHDDRRSLFPRPPPLLHPKMLAKTALRQSARSSAVASSSRRTICSSSATPSSSTRPSVGQVRSYSVEQQSFSPSTPSEPLFSSKPVWDDVFQNIGNVPVPMPKSSVRHRTGTGRVLAGGMAPRRQSMTIREMSAFDDMFSRIFNAAQQSPSSSTPDLSADSLWGKGEETGVREKKEFEVGDLFSQVRRHAKKVLWATREDEELDRKKEEMMMCETDLELLEWAQREVFDESRRFEERAREAVKEGKTESVQLQPAFYPHMVASLMRTFREKYGDPHLALSIFSHTRHLSVPSFVFGCSTAAYNELIETKWRCFRDLRGVCDALEEMRVNGVNTDMRTKGLCEMVRRECGERELWSEERNVGSGEVWEMVQFIDKVVAGVSESLFFDGVVHTGRRRSEVNAVAEAIAEEYELGGWKRRALRKEDGWEFGQWGDARHDDELALS
ncbi:hypothetical protein BXZ70DRAFT_960728 [Cristinia sonorae]|uniref:Mtf2-like C-terminal domain-containing protein n=1 Tax=Cristinia sonorae TaxID=1940300 RepID=A0A8K0UF54_9AGAR|nr:hypothetical protein BXZ70DRAFT_960728 [Cristinia sonorae]